MIVALGNCMVGIVMQTDPPGPQRSRCFAQATVSPGGSAANFAVWAARLSAGVGLIAKVGDDMLGDVLLHDLEREGAVSGVAVGAETTALTLALEGAVGKRTMFAA